MKKNKVFLIDANALIYRSYYAFIKHPLINKKGVNTGAIYGTINGLIKIIDKFNPEYIAVSFDLKGPTFRKEISSDYKANRKPMPDELIPQIQPIHDFFEIIGIPEFSETKFEADDMIGSLANYFGKDNEVVLVSGDKDFVQLIKENVSMYNPFKNEKIDEEYVIDKYGISAQQFVDYLGIMGDSADNIPGINGIGAKGAYKLLSEFGSLEKVYENLDNIKSQSMKKKLIKSKDEAFLSRKLATIVTDIDFPNLKLEDIKFSKNNLRNTIDFLHEFELTSILKNIESRIGDIDQNEESESKISFDSILITEEQQLDKMCDELSKFSTIAIDTETTSIDSMVAELVGVSISAENKKGYYVSVSHQLAQNIDEDIFISKITKLLKGKLLIGHNLKYDLQVLENFGITLNNNIFDTMIASYVLNPNKLRHNLDSCAQNELGYEMKPISDLIGKGKKQITFDIVPQNDALFYAVEDANIAFRLYHNYLEKIKENDLSELFFNIEIPLVRVLQKVERNGVFVNQSELQKLSNKFQQKMSKLAQEVFDIAGYQFNLNSTQQLSKLLFEDLNIKPIKKTKTGFSTNSEVLEKLSHEHEIAKLMLAYRQLAKLESTYTTALQKLVNDDTNRIHTSFNQAVTSTGRLSSTNPNLQNIPIRSVDGKEIRKAFTASDNDKVIIAADYSQIELRLMALFSQDPNMLEAYKNDQDIHSQTASIIFEKEINEISRDDRSRAKVINFGLLYGMGSRKLANELKIKQSQAKEFIDNYFNKFPTIKQFRDDAISKAREKGYAKTLFGRKLALPELVNPSNYSKMQVSGSERVAVNMPIQGTAADLIKIAMINIDKEIESIDGIKMIIQVHDELVFEVDRGMIELAENIIREKMEEALPEMYRNTIRLKVDINHGNNWFEAH